MHRRLQLHYGAGYGLSYESILGEGTTVTVKFAIEPLPVKDTSREYSIDGLEDTLGEKGEGP
ncbi:hypothetical protein D3C73_1674070 [compost metagenome]